MSSFLVPKLLMHQIEVSMLLCESEHVIIFILLSNTDENVSQKLLHFSNQINMTKHDKNKLSSAIINSLPAAHVFVSSNENITLLY